MKNIKKTLAILGGDKVRTDLFPSYRTMMEEEKKAVMKVMDSGALSRYLGCWHEDFMGGDEVRALESEWAKEFGVKYAIAVNSASSGLQCAVGALHISPGDEIIVSPYSMCISATAPLLYGAIPVFADIEKDYFCLDPESVRAKITPRTKAILIVDLFGLPHNVAAIREIAKEHNLAVIEDAAQAPMAEYEGKLAGTFGDMGVFSLNYHKHIHAGEGGIIVTDDKELAERVRLIRNHAEAVVEGKGVEDITNMLGFNFRLTELQAAIAREQLKKVRNVVDERIENCKYLESKLSGMEGIVPAPLRPGTKHAYYIHPFIYNEEVVGIPRDVFVGAVKAELPLTGLREKEGVLMGAGYAKPLYLMPIFQQRIAFGKSGYPFTLSEPGAVSYEKGICPVVEDLHENSLITHEMMRPGMSRSDLDDVATAFLKVYEGRDLLKEKN